ncbi:hypothetical protein ACF1E9_16475 [Streptomyces roseolus]|uniref:hypothetical protein n=1 Tax=Streptomyces roseolus TaxID=67358 RepID=UPI0036F8710A
MGHAPTPPGRRRRRRRTLLLGPLTARAGRREPAARPIAKERRGALDGRLGRGAGARRLPPARVGPAERRMFIDTPAAYEQGPADAEQ